MDRQVTYYGALARALDVLLTGQNSMVGLAKLAQSVLGTGTCASDFTCAPTAPASLAVVIGPGAIYQLENLEQSAISLLSPDTHSIIKQGLLADALPITLTPPATVGFSQNILIEAQYADSDSGNTLLNYYNASNPASPFNGPGNNGQQQPTIRKGIVSLQAKYGTPATSGTQTTPAPDAGWVGLFVVNVANGQTTITSGNISIYAGAPFIPATLMALPGIIQSNAWRFTGLTTNSSNAFAGSIFPIPAALVAGMSVETKMNVAPTGAATFNLNGLGAVSIVKPGGSALSGGEWAANDFVTLKYTGSAWSLSGVSGSGSATSDSQYWHFCSAPAGGTANALTAIASPVPSSLAAGTHVILYASAVNTGTATLALNGLATKSIVNRDGTALLAGQINTIYPLWLMYDGNYWVLMIPLPASSANVAKAWVDFDGTTIPPTIRSSYNVSSVIRVSAGVYRVVFTQTLSANGTCVLATASQTGGYGLYATAAAPNGSGAGFTTPNAAGEADVFTTVMATQSPGDCSWVSVAVFQN